MTGPSSIVAVVAVFLLGSADATLAFSPPAMLQSPPRPRSAAVDLRRAGDAASFGRTRRRRRRRRRGFALNASGKNGFWGGLGRLPSSGNGG
eukprot:CAMPEP_0113552300 /NCGR_PEP_ID=MMETSP0015_2-20120614/14993_1 /TAXON_ID=2838 /ORGANISM="Odontella" /LENGTH=91 /DNA_ID=CAMNT_0000453267 /DNA_START=36 /DNA_END=307 /DNA_ORIENTATION=- /assembly_acc=CAM_ASM_000160